MSEEFNSKKQHRSVAAETTQDVSRQSDQADLQAGTKSYDLGYGTESMKITLDKSTRTRDLQGCKIKQGSSFDPRCRYRREKCEVIPSFRQAMNNLLQSATRPKVKAWCADEKNELDARQISSKMITRVKMSKLKLILVSTNFSLQYQFHSRYQIF